MKLWIGDEIVILSKSKILSSFHVPDYLILLVSESADDGFINNAG